MDGWVFKKMLFHSRRHKLIPIQGAKDPQQCGAIKKKDKFGLASLAGNTHHHRVVRREWRQRCQVVSVAPSGCGCLWPPVPFPCTSALYSCPVCPLSNCTYASLLTWAHSFPESRVAVCQYWKNCLSHCCSLLPLTEIFFPFGAAERSALLVRF